MNGDIQNLHQSHFEFSPEASALIFPLRMLSAVKIMPLYTVVVRQVNRAKNHKTRGGEQQLETSERGVPKI